MYKVISISILILFFSWKSKKNENLLIKQTTEVIQNSKNFKFVIAESGLNYRSEPKGKVLGKFEWREKVEYLYETGITQKIIDNYTEVEGTWVAVKNKKDTVFVFDYYLSYHEPSFSKTKLYYAEPYFNEIRKPSNERDIRQAFVNVSESFYMPKNFLEKKDLRKDTIYFNKEQRKEFFKRMKYSITDSIFIYDFKSGIIKKHLVDKTPIIACISIYAKTDEEYKTQDYDEWSYQIGFYLGKMTSAGFAMIAKENPFVENGLQQIIFEEMDSASIEINIENSLVPEGWKNNSVPAYTFSYENTTFFVKKSKDSYGWNNLIVKNVNTKESVDVGISGGESSSLAPIKIKGEKGDHDNYFQYQGTQYIGKLFKDKPTVVFGFTYKSFGCPSIEFIDKQELPILILCDNRH